MNKLTQRRQDTGKRLTLAEKLIIYAEKGNGKSPVKLGKEYGCSDSTVKRIWKDKNLTNMTDRVALVKETLADEFYLKAHECVSQIGNTIHKASAKDAAIAAAVCVDKARLLDQKTTANVGISALLSFVNDTPV
jgi:hypothetical protein